ncbi:MAG: NUDIX hydrolase [Nitrospirae bacterium RBG_13_39_12]|nr:MAG: NUDIX hydrolase [Nitrospirae bacterium RBG_13_39_12]
MKNSSNPRNPFLTIDLIIEYKKGIILIKRKNPPEGWALPGGFVDYGETLESAALREAKEETDLNVKLLRQFHSYSDPERDPRHHTVTIVFIAKAKGNARAGDDARKIGIFTKDILPDQIAFDHRDIINDYFTGRY